MSTKKIPDPAVTELRDLISALEAKGKDATDISVAAGYVGVDGAKDIQSMKRGACLDAATRLARLRLWADALVVDADAKPARVQRSGETPFSADAETLLSLNAAITALEAKGESLKAISKAAGFTGSNGKRDVVAMKEGRCKDVAGRTALLRAYIGGGAKTLRFSVRDASAGVAAPQGGTSTVTSSSDHVAAAASLAAAVETLQSRGMSALAISKAAGYSGANARRDVRAMKAGRCNDVAARAERLRTALVKGGDTA